MFVTSLVSSTNLTVSIQFQIRLQIVFIKKFMKIASALAYELTIEKIRGKASFVKLHNA